MKPLSPAAQALLDAYGDFEAANIDAMAAALRALAVRIAGADAIRQNVLAIADELEAQ
tara:strand:- start:13642 stop:13815 length:174 start_codon:yes stop_codon:yes gene_type:complete